MATINGEPVIENIREHLNNIPVPESRKAIYDSTDYRSTQTYLRFFGSTQKGEIKYEKSPQFHRVHRENGFAMNPVQKASLFRKGKVDCVGPHQVVPVEGEKLDIPKYYSNQEIDYVTFFEDEDKLKQKRLERH
ncbi:hypothetical protein DICPUDRAFT_35825 [Dictyostelium purpureum]|uniref:Uncharacterized protein n=1 Tax=Dictyostelium purpureum TaxID=5786 RepID=F0ZPX0_DICPU|nr:uncharacterized protein DICPUDRAFT_35825 [Dictyostelium purpureum]EGC34023.1 hypothetical protein DICPUDRAFT_35825 [Dictyostelium purpureum]|eukprot:XP_003289467.1 hypothetical protein DICPUDRAFT_35825 [Dictyostelium purpureum]